MKMNFNEKQSCFHRFKYKYVGLRQQINGSGFALNPK